MTILLPKRKEWFQRNNRGPCRKMLSDRNSNLCQDIKSLCHCSWGGSGKTNTSTTPPLHFPTFPIDQKPEKKAHWFKTHHLPNLQKGEERRLLVSLLPNILSFHSPVSAKVEITRLDKWGLKLIQYKLPYPLFFLSKALYLKKKYLRTPLFTLITHKLLPYVPRTSFIKWELTYRE